MNGEEFNELFLRDPSVLAPFLSSFFERLRNTNDLLRRELEQRQVPSSQLHQLIEKGLHSGGHETLHPLPRITLTPKSKETRQAGAPSSITLDRLPYRIGRRQATEGADILCSNDLPLNDNFPYQISRNHCSIERLGAEIVVRDRGSTLGTLLNGHPIGTEAEHMITPSPLGKTISSSAEREALTSSLCSSNLPSLANALRPLRLFPLLPQNNHLLCAILRRLFFRFRQLR